MALVTGIVTMVRLTRSMPRKLTESTLYSSPTYYVDSVHKVQPYAQKLQAPAITDVEYFSVMKRMAELEEKVNVLAVKPAAMPAEKEEMLNNALSRVDVLEKELMAAKKVPSSHTLFLSPLSMFCIILNNFSF